MESALCGKTPCGKFASSAGRRDSHHTVASAEALATRLSAPHRPATTSHWARLRRRWRNVFIPTYALARQEGNPDMTVDRFYGGIVHRGFMATKLVTHPHWHDHDDLPEGWTGQFAACLQDCVLPGFSVFSHRHALEAASALLKKHKIRFKNPYASGGEDQSVIDTVRSLDSFLAEVSEVDIANGLVLEEDVDNSTTYSVGQIQLGNHVGTYLGRQYSSRDKAGKEFYAGSRLRVVRGDWDALLQLLQSPTARKVVENARRYDEAAREHLGLVASRRNYDVLVGPITENGVRCGVLEQSWRVGGASPLNCWQWKN
ncbi:DUF3182 family protein [Ochrobactrum intermedium]|nr:DUF3182 family protein [Brucella intermedia]